MVVGARSALFLPYADLGLIIVDEEHDPAYKQEDGAHYHARDMAVVRGSIAKIPVVLASATPSVESEVNARRGRYRHLHLPERFGGAHLPAIEAIDMRREGPPRGRFISPRLAEAVQHTLERKEQALLFLNRRGYAPLTLCRACGFRLQCPNCDAWLVDHRFRRRLVCHHCGFSMPPPAECPNCHATESFAPIGPGVERLEQEAAELFPGARILVLSSDLVEFDRAAARRARRRGAKAASIWSSARSSSPRAIIFPSSIWSASSTPISASATAIRAPPSAPSNCCIRWSAAPAARRAAASASCRRTSPSIR